MPRTPQINRLVNLRKRLESEYNNKLYVDTLKIKKTKNRLTHVDLFSGAGGIKYNILTLNNSSFRYFKFQIFCGFQYCQNRLRDATYFTIRSIFIFAFT